MFRKIQIKLSLICCLATALIVLVIMLCCLNVSEKNMYGQEKTLFFLKANAISSDLHVLESIRIDWYMKNFTPPDNILYIEINGSPSTLSSLILSGEDLALIRKTKEHIKKNHLTPNTRGGSSAAEQHFEYLISSRKYLVMNGMFYKNKQELSYIYLYSLERFFHNVKMQRILFFSIWLFSIFILYVFSHIFTSRALKPVIQNEEKQKNFIAVASHELRSPLAVFKTGLSVLKNKPDAEKTTRIFSLLEHEMSRMERLVGDLLYLSKVENAGLKFHFEHVSLADLLTSIYEQYAEIAQKKRLTFSITIAAPGDYSCFCDRQRIEQAIIILLENALSYTPSGQSVTLNLYRSHKKYYIQVIDTGTGIPDSEKEKIFDRFYQVNTSHNQKEHFGLGLSIAKEICHVHGGNIFVDDTKGGGSAFTLKLPLKQ